MNPNPDVRMRESETGGIHGCSWPGDKAEPAAGYAGLLQEHWKNGERHDIQGAAVGFPCVALVGKITGVDHNLIRLP